MRGRDSNPRSRAHEAREDGLSSTALSLVRLRRTWSRKVLRTFREADRHARSARVARNDPLGVLAWVAVGVGAAKPRLVRTRRSALTGPLPTCPRDSPWDMTGGAYLAGRSRTCDLRFPRPAGWPTPPQPGVSDMPQGQSLGHVVTIMRATKARFCRAAATADRKAAPSADRLGHARAARMTVCFAGNRETSGDEAGEAGREIPSAGVEPAFPG